MAFFLDFRVEYFIAGLRHPMRVSRAIWIVLACLTAVIAGGALSVWLLWPRIVAYGIDVHQKSVTRELAEWGQEYSTINNDADAIRAAAMVGYMSHYYVPSSGYRGSVEVETALEKQRRLSIDRVVASLELYTGLHYGASVERWTEWASERKKRLSIQSGNEPLPSTR